jgi:hypothetical protein
MDWKPKDWIEHPTYGIGQVSENRGDKLDIDFVGTGRKTLLKSTELKPATPPSPDFKFPSAKGKSRTPRFKVQHPPKQPPLDFNYLVEGFVRFFDGGGFDSTDFYEKELKDKRKAADTLKAKLGKDAFESLLREAHYAEVWEIAKNVLQSTNLVHHIEKAKFVDGKNVAYQERFANVFYDLLHGSSEMEGRFTNFCSLLSDLGANKWTIATYYQFLSADDKWMFMKPEVTQQMAESLNRGALCQHRHAKRSASRKKRGGKSPERDHSQQRRKQLLSAPAKRTMSASARRKIAAFQHARWAKIRAGQKKAT